MNSIRRTVSALLTGAFLAAQSTEADCLNSANSSVGNPHAAVARKLVADNVWGVVSTISLHLNGAPWGNVLSLSDGTEGNHSGIPYLYLSPMDPTLQDLGADPRCTLTISQLSTAEGCDVDPEDPNCAKLSMSGKMLPAEDLETAKEALFTRHPEMASWPPGHGFKFMQLHIESLFLLDHYGGAIPLSLH